MDLVAGPGGRLAARHRTARLMETGEYLTQLHRFEDFGPALRTRTDHILIDSPTAAPDHAHRGPPGRRGC
ncbi:hypothetical protein [Streptomyces spiralis]|uniref:hypothetical protein n=1 Tax=Streptomyces spiralis TaxID=66376 RepID=UPI001677D37C|nr:hypothetical protein [Streptomyces spiralis]